MTAVEILNRRLGEGLGLVLGGSQPRFKWCKAEDCFYYLREGIGESFQRYCWADRIGKVWLLCQWDVPKFFDPRSGSTRILNESDWWVTFKGAMPFPKNGEYRAQAETALAPGCMPTAELTANYIWAIDKQMSSSYEKQLIENSTEIAMMRRERENKFYEQANDLTPAFGSWASGERGGHVSFGGM